MNTTVDWSGQRFWEDVGEGEELPPVGFPLTVYRLVVEAGANRDFNAIHHNSEFARASGAPEMYADTMFLLGMWERAVREFIGVRGRIVAIKGFRMTSFNAVGQTVTVKGRVKATHEGGSLVDIEVWSENDDGVSVGPGTVTVSLPRRG